MKKLFKRILTGIGILIVITVFAFVGYMMKAKSFLKNTTPTETKQIVDNIFAIKDSFVNLFLIKDSDQYLAIDGGNDIDIVSGELKKLNIEPDKIVAVMLTHTDGDHVAALRLFKNAKIFLSMREAQMINSGKSRLWEF